VGVANVVLIVMETIRAEILVVILTIAAGLAAWTVAIGTLGYDYDEVMRTHSIWLAAQGLCPYSDFLDCHPPYFGILASFVRIYPDDPCALLWLLRVVGALGNLVFLCGLVALGMMSVSPGRLAAIVGVTLVAVHPAILEFLAEFRIDGWGYAIAVWSVYRFRRLRRGTYRNFEVGVLTGIPTFWFCPKVALLPPLIVLFEHLLAGESMGNRVRCGLAYIAGLGVAAGLFALYLTWQGIDLARTFEILVRYNAVSNANLATRYGLFHNIVRNRAVFWGIVAGTVVWVVHHFRREIRPDAYEVALAAWLVMQPLLVSYPYKQYYAPWLLFASVFLAHLVRRLGDYFGRVRVLVILIVCAMAVLTDYRTAKSWCEAADAKTQRVVIRWMNSVTRHDDRVVASPPLHPIDRYDTFFLWFNTLDRGGFDSEQILARLPRYQSYVAAGRFREELNAYMPALVALSGDWRVVPYTSGQREALSNFLQRNNYVAVRVGTSWFALRPDRFEQARRNGLLEPLNKLG
jgi:hypothetical protein